MREALPQPRPCLLSTSARERRSWNDAIWSYIIWIYLDLSGILDWNYLTTLIICGILMNYLNCWTMKWLVWLLDSSLGFRGKLLLTCFWAAFGPWTLAICFGHMKALGFTWLNILFDFSSWGPRVISNEIDQNAFGSTTKCGKSFTIYWPWVSSRPSWWSLRSVLLHRFCGSLLGLSSSSINKGGFLQNGDPQEHRFQYSNDRTLDD